MAETAETDEVDYYEEGQGDEDYEEGEGGEEGEDEPEDMNKRVLEMEDELNKLTEMQQQVERQIHSASDSLDENSVYVGQVDYEATPEELRAHFAPCGTINRITIMVDKVTGNPKGFAYIEFVDKESVENALKLDDTLFKGRQLKVLPKRQNVPTFSRGRGRGRGGGRFRGGGRGGGRFASGGRFRGRGRGSFRGSSRGRGGYHSSYY